MVRILVSVLAFLLLLPSSFACPPSLPPSLFIGNYTIDQTIDLWDVNGKVVRADLYIAGNITRLRGPAATLFTFFVDDELYAVANDVVGTVDGSDDVLYDIPGGLLAFVQDDLLVYNNSVIYVRSDDTEYAAIRLNYFPGEEYDCSVVEEQSGTSSSLLVLIGALIVLLLCVVAGVVYFRKTRKSNRKKRQRS